MESERKALEVRHSLNALFANASVGIIIAGYDGKIKMANPLAEKLFGYHASEIQAMGLSQFFLDNCNVLSDLGAGSGLRETELTALNSKGDAFPVELRSSSYQLDGLNYQIIFLNDISERKKQEEIIRRSNEELKAFAKQLKETNAELENFAYISSHDLQEPLRKIQSFGDRLLHSEAEKFSEKGAEYMTRILSAAERMQRLINDLLSLSRLSSKARPFETVHLGTIVNEVISDLEVSIRNSNARIHVLDELPVIEADPTQMRQLFQNLIANAIKFKKPDEDPLIKIYAVQSQNDQAGMVNIMVEDNGIGFDEKYLGKIFVIFQRLESAKYPGSGIGLAICKKIVQRHNGEINARSAKGQGSRFIIRLPLPTANKTVSPIHHSTLIAA
jgi:two-component system sensor kinase FixL